MGDYKWYQAYKTFKETKLVYRTVKNFNGTKFKYMDKEDSLTAYAEYAKLQRPVASILFECFAWMDNPDARGGQGYGLPKFDEIVFNENNFQDLIGKVVIFTDKTKEHDIDFDEGMKAKITGINKENDNSYKFTFDMSEYVEHNTKLMKVQYFDKQHKPTLKWIESPFYPITHIIYYWFTLDELPFVVDMG